MKKIRAKVGDVFRIRIDDARCAYGQVFLMHHGTFNLYIGVFGPAFPADSSVDLETICESDLALVGATEDALIYHGDWRIVGNRQPDISRLPRPRFQIDLEGKTVVEDFDGNFVRVATEEDIKHYDLRWSRGPIGFERAIQAQHGASDWQSDFERLTIQHAVEQSR